MEQIDRNKIDQNVDQIVEKLDMQKLWPKLLENEIFYDDDPNVPRWEKNWNDPVIMKDILLKVKTRGPDAYENLIRSLKETDQHELTDILEKRSISPIDSNEENGNETEDDQSDTNSLNDEDYLSDLSYNPAEAKEPLKIKVRKSTRFHDEIASKDPLDKYPMRSSPRGLVLIITLIEYRNFNDVRTAAELDEQNLIDLFQQMGFKVQAKRNLTATEIKQEIQAFSQNQELRKVDSCFVVMSGHGGRTPNGEDSILMGIDHFGVETSEPSREVSYGEIISYFTAEKCPLMINKPKIFLTQFCRGSLLQTVVPNKNCKMDNSHLNLDLDRGDNNIIHIHDTNSSIRNYSDILIAHSTLPDSVSYRDKQNGSWFIQIFCEVLMKFAYKIDVDNLLNITDARLKPLRTGDDQNYGQTTVILKMGFRQCFLNPGLFENNS